MPALLMLRIALASLSVMTTARPPGQPGEARDMVRRYELDYASRAAAHAGIPSFSRQTGLACSECHTSFPQLNSFGRKFKLNGYTLADSQVVSAVDKNGREALRVGLLPPVSAMVQTSYTQTSMAQPGVQNGTAEFPQQLSVFFGAAISPRIGAFVQMTYDPRAGGIGMDNADIRYANHTTLGATPLLYGVTLNNNPTVQDVWNTVPAWGFPFASSAVAPSPSAATLLDGGLGQQVAGLGAYALLNDHLYAEFTTYRTALQGGPSPLDSTATNAIGGVAPYWRAFYKQQFGQQSLMVGTLGMSASLYPEGIKGLQNRFTDVAFDAQYERPLGGGTLTAHAIWIHESQALDADFAGGTSANPSNTLQTLRIDASAYTKSMIGLTIGMFSTTGTTDALRFPAGAMTGSATGSPNSGGFIAEISALPWQNTRFEIQYVGYSKFNGAATNYDGAGRNASHNNTLYLLSWVAF